MLSLIDARQFIDDIDGMVQRIDQTPEGTEIAIVWPEDGCDMLLLTGSKRGPWLTATGQQFDDLAEGLLVAARDLHERRALHAGVH